MVIMNIDKGVNLVQKIPDILSKTALAFSKFRPDINNLSINCRDRLAEMALRFKLPDNILSSMKKTLYEVKLPSSSVTSIKMYSGALLPVENAWTLEDGYYVLDFSKLPEDSEIFMATLKIDLSQFGLDHLVSVKSPINPKIEQDKELYWLQASIKEPNILSSIYNKLEIYGIEVPVKVNIQRCFTTALPPDFHELLSTPHLLAQAMDKRNKNEINKIRLRRSQLRREVRANEAEIIKVILKLYDESDISNYLSVDKPFRKDEIETLSEGREQSNIPLLPSKIGVNVSTDLTLDKPAADGNLTFDKERYTNSVKEKIEKGLSN